MDEHKNIAAKRRGGLRKWLILAAVIVVVGLAVYRGIGSTQKKSEGRRPPRGEIPVEVVSAVRKPMSYSLRATADIVPLMQVDLFPRVSGYLERIDVRLGDYVRQGQVVAQIDRSDFLQKVRETEAKLAYAKAQLSELEAGSRPEELRQAEEGVKQARSRFDNARQHRERVEALYKRQVISKKEMDQADMEYNVADAQLAASQQNLGMVREGARGEAKDASRAKVKEMEALLAQERIRFENTQIAAPFRGEICKRYVDAGALVSSSTPVVGLIHTDTLKVVANVLEKDVSLVKIGMKARIEAQSLPAKFFEGKITRINSALDSATRTLQAEIEIPNSGRMLKPGMFVKLEVVLSEKPQALVVPRYAVLEDVGAKFVFVVKENQAFRRPVTTGFEQDPYVEILEGITEGERVVVKGQESARDRSPVRIQEGE